MTRRVALAWSFALTVVVSVAVATMGASAGWFGGGSDAAQAQEASTTATPDALGTPILGLTPVATPSPEVVIVDVPVVTVPQQQPATVPQQQAPKQTFATPQAPVPGIKATPVAKQPVYRDDDDDDHRHGGDDDRDDDGRHGGDDDDDNSGHGGHGRDHEEDD